MYNFQRVCIGGLILVFAACLPVVVGCGPSGKRVISGTVTHNGQPVDAGRVSFVPIEGTKGPINVGMITDGRYRIEARAGVPAGTYRVEVSARKKTGHKRRELADMKGEMVQLGPIEYAGAESPLRFEVGGDSGDQFDIEIPAQY